MEMHNPEEGKGDVTKNWLNERKQFEILTSEVSMKWKN